MEKKKTILIVDDDMDWAQILEGFVHMLYGVTPLYAPNGEAALRTLERTNVDVILSDTNMPIMNGIELMKVVLKQYPQIQFVIFFDKLNGEEALTTQGVTGLGAHGVLKKSEALEVLGKMLDPIFRKS